MKKAAVGELEQLVLLAVLRLRDNAYTVAIREEIAGRAGRRLSRGAVYATLERLEGKGLLASHFGEPSPERGGKAKKFFRALPAAIALLEENQRALYAMWDGIDWATEKR
jgi:DNA-binding PadR family transcriptional regulator